MDGHKPLGPLSPQLLRAQIADARAPDWAAAGQRHRQRVQAQALAGFRQAVGDDRALLAGQEAEARRHLQGLALRDAQLGLAALELKWRAMTHRQEAVERDRLRTLEADARYSVGVYRGKGAGGGWCRAR